MKLKKLFRKFRHRLDVTCDAWHPELKKFIFFHQKWESIFIPRVGDNVYLGRYPALFHVVQVMVTDQYTHISLEPQDLTSWEHHSDIDCVVFTGSSDSEMFILGDTS